MDYVLFVPRKRLCQGLTNRTTPTPFSVTRGAPKKHPASDFDQFVERKALLGKDNRY